MQEKAFGCLNGVFECKRNHSNTLEAKSGLLRWRVSGCIEEAFGCYKINSNAQEGIRILKGLLLHGGYANA